MTELSFLLDILLNHKIGKATKDAIKARIDEIQTRPVPMQTFISHPLSQMTEAPIAAAASERAHIEPVQIAAQQQTPAAQAALQQRAALIRQAQSGVIEKGQTSPPKSYHL